MGLATRLSADLTSVPVDLLHHQLCVGDWGFRGSVINCIGHLLYKESWRHGGRSAGSHDAHSATTASPGAPPPTAGTRHHLEGAEPALPLLFGVGASYHLLHDPKTA